MQFVRSGRISVSKEKMQISLLLEELKINKKLDNGKLFQFITT
jgi:hypothetical protein